MARRVKSIAEVALAGLRKREAEAGWGIFVWRGDNVYRRGDALKVYKSRAAADAYVRKPEAYEKNLVVRSLYYARP